ncbi:hypothetical protein DCAR_0830552 [Daucus carota subsp. sativus]|uniref:Transposase n=2 Tax=Daucus carota subsp. sativus TaxID=79200 RepID=A0AAF0XN02_DAUCS|nr:hypothetical protein DCAR_0830552 [Daucus carota subsp. sativus]
MSTVQRIWKRSKESPNGDVSHRRTKNSGRKKIQIDLAQFRNILLTQRTTIRGAANALNVSTSKLHRCLKEGEIRRQTNDIKPLLKEENKKARLKFCLSVLDKDSLHHEPKFIDMDNIIHIDEKWFHLTKKFETYYLVLDEDVPHRTCKNKNFVGKVMFLAAIARPRFDSEGNITFSGKVGIWPFVTKEPAKRRSVKRATGTMETKVMTSVGKSVIREFFIGKVLPSIQSRWPSEDANKIIYIQQDNARTHLDPSDPEFCEAAKQYGFDLRLMCQPANSPDLNVLDHGFFSAIQSLRYKVCVRTIDELIDAVENAYETFSPVLSNNIFLTLQSCMLEIMKTQGSNRYKLSHMKKNRLRRQGELPRQLKCDPKLIEDVRRMLD